MSRLFAATTALLWLLNSYAGGSPLPSTPLEWKLYQGPFALESDRTERAPAKVYLPNQYAEKSQWPLVVLLHGFSGTAETEDTYLTLRFRTSLRGFILLTPEGSQTPAGTTLAENDVSGNQFWNATDFCCDFGKTGVDDVAYLKNLIQAVKTKFNVDEKRVYVLGHSNGGFMANRLACEMGEDIAAIANLGGGSFARSSDCKQPVPIPYLQIHATNDETISYSPAPLYAGGEETVEQWTDRNGCGSPVLSADQKDFLILIPGDDTDETSWQNCTSGKEVMLWTIRAYETKGHNPHIPLFNLNFTGAVLDFLFRHETI